MTTAPVLFIAHGSPMAALADASTDRWAKRLDDLARELERPRAILAISAHDESPRAITVGASSRPPTIHDFGGFPPAIHALEYPVPGDPGLAADLVQELTRAGMEARLDADKGLDHGSWVPLRRIFPQGSVPVVPIAMPTPLDCRTLLKLGGVLGRLRADRCLLLCSGAIVHNLRLISPVMSDDAADDWARRFDSAVAEAIDHMQPQLLLGNQLPDAAQAAPTAEHLAPLVVAMGARQSSDRVIHLHSGFHHRNLSMRSVIFAAPSSLTGLAA